MNQVAVGQPAPSFRLPFAQGAEIGLADYRGRSNLILFFAKGMACGFCRQKMSQLARGYPRFKQLDTEILQIAPTTLQRGRFYARHFPLPFPYLCDPDYRVFEAYGMTVRPHSIAWKVAAFAHVIRLPGAPETELGPAKPSLGELGRLLNDDDLGVFIVDKEGVIRYASVGEYVTFEGARPVGMRPIPDTDEIVRELEDCQRRRARASA